jgi:hypothetical protein
MLAIYGKGRRAILQKEVCVPIKIGNYVKKILLRRIIEISVIRWKKDPTIPARTPNHGHSVPELSCVLWRRIYEIRHGIKRYHHWGSIIWVPKGTIHEVGVDVNDGPALSINLCFGILSMKIYPSTTIK